MKATHRVLAESDEGKFLMLFRGTEGQCRQYMEVIAKREANDEPVSRYDMDRMLPSGWCAYIAAIDTDTVVKGRERAYEVAGTPLASAVEVQTKIDILAAVDTGSDLTHAYARAHRTGNVNAVREIRKEAWRLVSERIAGTVGEALELINEGLEMNDGR